MRRTTLKRPVNKFYPIECVKYNEIECVKYNEIENYLVNTITHSGDITQ